MRTFRFHPQFPEGKIFDDTGREAPFPPPKGSGWVEHREELKMSYLDMGSKMVENAVKAELAQQEKEGRAKLDAEHKKKYGFEPPVRASTEQVANIMDNKLLDGQARRPTLHLPRKPTSTTVYSRPSERASAKDK